MIATIAVINGCASNENYHTILEDCIYIKAGDCSQAAIQHYHDDTDLEYHLGFVEFDDQGLLRDRKQLKEVLEHFKSIAETQFPLSMAGTIAPVLTTLMLRTFASC